MIRRLIILLLIVGCGTEPEDDKDRTDVCIDNYYPDATLYDANNIYGITDSLLIGSWELTGWFGYNNYCCEGEPDTSLDMLNGSVTVFYSDVQGDSNSNQVWNIPNTSNLCYYTPIYDDLNCSVFYELTDNNLIISDPTPNSEMCNSMEFIKLDP